MAVRPGWRCRSGSGRGGRAGHRGWVVAEPGGGQSRRGAGAAGGPGRPGQRRPPRRRDRGAGRRTRPATPVVAIFLMSDAARAGRRSRIAGRACQPGMASTSCGPRWPCRPPRLGRGRARWRPNPVVEQVQLAGQAVRVGGACRPGPRRDRGAGRGTRARYSVVTGS